MASENRREAILDAAQMLFMDRDWEAVTIADVPDAAGISDGGTHHQFTAREDLRTGIVERMTAKALRAVQEALDATSGNVAAQLNACLGGAAR